MRMVLMCFLLGGCSLIDRVADGGGAARSYSRISVGGGSVVLSMREDLDRYSCSGQALVCDAVGSKWACSCEDVSLEQH